MLEASQTSQGTTFGRRKRLPPVTTMFIEEEHSHLRRPTPFETTGYEVSPEALQETTVTNKRQSRNILGLFSRNKSNNDGVKEEVGAGGNTSPMAGKPVQDKSKRMSYLRKTEQSQITETQTGPLPFSEALPKCLKHITLAVPSIDADGLLKLQKLRKDSKVTAPNETELYPDAKVQESKRRNSATISSEWMTSTFVLSTKGLLSQYAAAGKPERLPERNIQLNSGSAAFASDAISGKHWVLQVTKSFSDDSTGAASISRLSRIGIRSNKSVASNMLLVMENAEDMEEWLAVLRREITSQGSETYQPEKIVPKASINAMQKIRERPSRRHLIEKDISSQSRMHSSQQVPGVTLNVQQRSIAGLSRPTYQPEIPNLKMDGSPSAVLETDQQSKTSPQDDKSNALLGSPQRKTSGPTLLKWELPSNYSSTFSPDLSSSQSIPSIQTQQPSEDSYPRIYRSASATSDGAPNFSVPTFSHRFSQSTRSGTSITTPPRSSGSSHRTSSPVQPAKDLLVRRGAATLPHIVTTVSTREVCEPHELQPDAFDNEWIETEDPIPTRSHPPQSLPKRFSSLNLLDSIRAKKTPQPSPPIILTPTRDLTQNPHSPAMSIATKRLSSLYPDSPRSTIASKRSSFFKSEGQSILLTPERATFFQGDSSKMKNDFLVPYPKVDAYELRRHSALGISHEATFELMRKNSISCLSTAPTRPPPNVPGKQASSTSPRLTPTTRPHSFQALGSPDLLQSKTSLTQLMPQTYVKTMTIRERRSFASRIPTHLLGPPAPPPMGPLPAIPRPKTSHVH